MNVTLILGSLYTLLTVAILVGLTWLYIDCPKTELLPMRMILHSMAVVVLLWGTYVVWSKNP